MLTNVNISETVSGQNARTALNDDVIGNGYSCTVIEGGFKSLLSRVDLNGHLYCCKLPHSLAWGLAHV